MPRLTPCRCGAQSITLDVRARPNARWAYARCWCMSCRAATESIQCATGSAAQRAAIDAWNAGHNETEITTGDLPWITD